MTRRLYNEDGYMQSFQAEVISCKAYKETTYQVVLDRTAFFPEGGGQSSDTGFLNQIKVLDVQEVKGENQEVEVIHIVENPLEIGEKVQGVINWTQRFDKMQQHTAEHVVSGIVHKIYGYKNVGFHLNSEIVTMDFDGVITREQANELEVLVNEVVVANVPIKIHYPSREELQELEYRSKIEIEGQVRLVEVVGYDTCACCAPHVKTTGEIGMVKLTDIQSHRGGVRIVLKCGNRALRDYQEKSSSVKTLSGLLSAPELEIVQGVERLKEELQNVRGNIWNLQNQLLECKLVTIQQQKHEKYIVVFEEDLDMDHVRELVNKLVLDLTEEKYQELQFVAAFIPNGEGYQYIIASQTVDVRTIGKKLNEVCNGRGGGKPVMVQGSILATRKEIETALRVECNL